MTGKKIVDGIKLPCDRSITDNEHEWITLLRLISSDADPAPTLANVQDLRRSLEGRIA